MSRILMETMWTKTEIIELDEKKFYNMSNQNKKDEKIKESEGKRVI